MLLAFTDSNHPSSLNVLRSLLAEVTNAAKTSNPIKTDIQFLHLIRKRTKASKLAVAEFSAANREDLKAKEESQVAVLDEYAGKVDTVGADEMRTAVRETIESLRSEQGKIDIGTVTKKIMTDGGVLEGKPVERGLLAEVIKENLHSIPQG